MIRDDFTEALGFFYTNWRVQIYSQQKGYRRGQSAKTVYTLLSQLNNRVLHVFGKSTMSITSFADYTVDSRSWAADNFKIYTQFYSHGEECVILEQYNHTTLLLLTVR